MNNKAIAVHKKTRIPYRYLGNNEFENIHTNQKGIVDDEKASKVFNVNLDATVLFKEYPSIELLVEKLELKIQL